MDVRVESPFPEHAVPRTWTWAQEFRSRVADDFGPQTLHAFMEAWQAKDQRTWGVWRGDELGGMVTVEPISPLVVSSHCLFKKSFWGHETTLPALQQVFREVFGAGVHKVFSLVFSDNHQMIGLAKKLGFVREGVLRRQTLRNGKLIDQVALGLLATEFDKENSNGMVISGANRWKRVSGVAGRQEISADIGIRQHVDGECFANRDNVGIAQENTSA